MFVVGFHSHYLYRFFAKQTVAQYSEIAYSFHNVFLCDVKMIDFFLQIYSFFLKPPTFYGFFVKNEWKIGFIQEKTHYLSFIVFEFLSFYDSRDMGRDIVKTLYLYI